MNASVLRRSWIALWGLLAVAPVVAAQAQAPAPPKQQEQQQAKPFEPQVGQAGKDVVWVPTPDELVDKMLDMAKLTPQDYLIDLGSGDGRTVIAAAKRGARAHGIEYNPDMVALSKANAEKAGVAGKATFEKADIFESDLSKATVITMFLLPQLNVKLRPAILQLKPGTRVVSNSFDMGDWVDDETANVQGSCSSWCTAHLWIVPARVEGTWRVGNGVLNLKQEYQMLSGTLEAAGKALPVEGRVRGAEVSFTAGGAQYVGQVNGSSIEGSRRVGNADSKWTATKATM